MQEHGYGLGVGIGAGGTTAVAWSGTADEPEVVPVPLDPARGARAVARLGSSTPLYEDGRGRSAAEVAGEIVAAACAAAEERLGRAPAWTVVAVPPSWGTYRTGLLTDALATVVGPRASVVSGALAATYAHLGSGRLADPATVAVYDLGAGTLDTAVVRATPGGEVQHLGTPPAPVPWGGEDIDDALLAHVLEALAPAATPDRSCARALRDEVVAAKEALSSDTATSLVAPPGAGGPADGLRLTREELDELIGPGVHRSVEVLHATITGAGLTVADIDAVVLLGGSVRMPLVGECLSAALERPLVVDAAPELTAAHGAARLALALRTEEDREADAGDAGPPAAARPAPSEAARAATRPALVARPPTAPRGSASRRPAGRSAARTTSRVLLVGALLLGLVLVVPTLSAALLSGGEPEAATPVAEAPAPPPGDADPAGKPPLAGSVDRPATGGGGELQPAAGRREARSPRPTATRPAGSVRAAAQRVATAATTAATSPPSAVLPGAAGSAGAPGSAAPTPPAGTTPAAPGTAAAGTTSPPAPGSSTTPAPTTPAPSTTQAAPTTTQPPPTTTPPALTTPTTPAPTTTQPPPDSPELPITQAPAPTTTSSQAAPTTTQAPSTTTPPASEPEPEVEPEPAADLSPTEPAEIQAAETPAAP